MLDSLAALQWIKGKRVVGLVALLFICFVGFLPAEEVCKFAYKGQPEDLHDTTITVNEKMVALSEYVYVGTPKGSIPVQITTPTIFFVIDNSTSMSTVGNPPNDQWGNRFNVTRDLMDSLYLRFPKAEVGVAAFRRYLYFDPADDDLLVQCPQQDTGAYIPLLRLDSSYAPSGEMGYEILKEWLETDTIDNDHVDLTYIPSNIAINRSNTNINCGFDAGKHAMLASQYEKACHYVIFLSDGEANYPRGSENAYVEGTGVPTTFTIYFTRTGNPPQELIDFTANVQINNYSTTNPSSNLWAFENTEYEVLMKFIMDSVVSVINQTQTSYPTDIVVNGLDPIDPWDSTGFTFADLFPLIGETTPFVFDIDYHIFVDSITDLGDTITIEKDTSTHIEFDVVVEDGAPDLPDTFQVDCWGRKLEFYYNGSQINAANETMAELEIRFTEYEVDILYGYEDVSVEITHTEGNQKDKENFELSDAGSYFAYTFPREIDSTPTVDDGTLQHHALDSIVAVFRNPKLPLDTLRVTIPFILSGVITVQCAYYFDNDAEGHIDSIFVKIDGDLTDDNVDEIMDSELLTLPEFRGFTIEDYERVDGGIALTVEQDLSDDPITYVTDEDSLVVKEAILSEGGWVMGGTVPIFDKVAPIIIYKKVKVIGENLWTPLLVDFQIDSIPDTLVVVFSEPIEEITKNVPFYFLDMENNVTYTANLDVVEYTDEQTVKFTVETINNNVDNMSDGDSIWIHEGDCVGDICLNEDGDTDHNYQNNKDNIHRLLRVESVMIIVDLNPISISPLDISNIGQNEMNIIPDEIITVLEDQGILDNLNLEQNNNGDFIGMVIQVIPEDIDIESMKDLHLEGWLSIFDAVGNQLVSNEEMAFNKENKTLNWAWNGRNSYSRMVASAMYLVLIDIKKYPQYNEKPNSYLEEVKRLFVAVKD